MLIKNRIKTCILFVLLFTITVQTTGCALFYSKSEKYQEYVKNLLDANYKGEFTEFMEMTDADEESVQAVYDDGIEYLTDALITYYGIQLVDNGDIRSQFVEITRNIYKNAKYEVQPAVKDKETGNYTVEVLIYPIDILDTTYDDVITYIDGFNTRKQDGYYDNYEIEEYEVEFAQGLIDILNDAIPTISYKDPVSVTVTIIQDEDSFYISDEDFTNLDHALIADKEDTSVPAEEATTEAQPAGPGIDDYE